MDELKEKLIKKYGIEDKSAYSKEDWENYYSSQKNVGKSKFQKSILFFVLWLALLWAVIYGFTHFLYGFIVVSGESMTNTLQDQQIGLIQKINCKEAVKRGDIIVFYSDELEEYLIKRMIALPGDEIEVGEDWVKVNGELIDEPYIKEPMYNVDGDGVVPKTELGKNQFFAMGDNRNGSYDCRALGPSSVDKLTGILRVNLGEFGITKSRAIIIFIGLFVLLMLIGFVQDILSSKKLNKLPNYLKEANIDLDLVDGKIYIGFRNESTNELVESEEIENEKQIINYCKSYGHDYKELQK